MFSPKKFVCFVAVAQFLPFDRGVKAQELQPTQVIAQYEKSLLPFDHCRFKATAEQHVESPSIKRGMHSLNLTYNPVLVGAPSHFRMLCKSKMSLKRNGKWIRNLQEFEFNLVGATRKEISWQGDKPNDKYISVLLDCVTDEERVDFMYSYPFSPITHGYLQSCGRNSLSQLLRQGDTSLSLARLKGKEVVRLESKTEWGLVTLWCDPDHGYLPLRIQSRKGLHDRIDAHSTVDSANWQGEFAGPASKKVGIDYSIEADYGLAKEISQVIEMTAVRTDRYESGETRQWTSKVHLYDLEFGKIPGREFDLTTQAPEKTPVDVKNHPDLMYEWGNGKVIKTGIVEPPDWPPLAMPGGGTWRWLVGAAIGIVALVVGWFLYAAIQKKRAS